MNGISAFEDELSIRIEDGVAFLTLTRPEKQNALNDRMLAALDRFFSEPGEDVRVAILSGAGSHFSAGLDLAEHVGRAPAETLRHSRNWHRIMDLIQFGGLPVISALHGGVIGGGLELAAATHVRVAEPSAFFQLPEGRRGIFVGGGASVRIGRILGADRLTEMMLTGRRYDAEEALALGLVHYRMGEGEAPAKAEELARQIAANAPLSNHLIIQSLARIDDMSRGDGLFTESLAAALSVSDGDAREGLTAFLEKRPAKFR